MLLPWIYWFNDLKCVYTCNVSSYTGILMRVYYQCNNWMLIMAVTMSNTAGMFQLFYNILTDGLCIYRYVWFTNKWNVYSVCLLMCHYMNSCVFNMFKLLQCYYSIYGKVYIQYVSKMNNLTEILCLYITVILFFFFTV